MPVLQELNRMNVTDCNIHCIMNAAIGVTKYMLTLISIRQSATRRLELSKIHQCENIKLLCRSTVVSVVSGHCCLWADRHHGTNR